MFRIGEFSKLSKTTIKALRFYDENELLKPAYVDPFTNYRFYTASQLYDLQRILSYRQIGLSIKEIKCLLSSENNTEILNKRKAELYIEILNAKKALSSLEFILSGKMEDDFMNYHAIIKELPECIVYSKKLNLPDYDAMFEAIPLIGEQVAAKYPEMQCSVPEYCFNVYLDGEYKETNINIELCEAVTELFPDFDDIHFKKIEKTSAVSVMHRGAYSGLGNAYAYAVKWAENNGYEISDNARENYINGIWNKENENDWLTEIQIPVNVNSSPLLK